MRSPLRNFFAANTTVSISDLKNPAFWLINSFLGRATKSGAQVTPDTAMTISAYWLGIMAISEDIAKLPLKTYRRLKPRGKEVANDHPNWRMLHDQPNPEMGSMTFRETMQHHILGWGNCFAEIVRNEATDRPMELWPIHPSRVTIERTRDEKRELRYVVKNDALDGAAVQPNVFTAHNIYHVHGLGSDGIQGYTPLQMRRESLGLSIQAETAGAAFFGSGMMSSGVIEHPEAMQPESLTKLRNQWKENYGGAENAGKPIILEQGMKWKDLDINPNDAQFLETRQFQVEEVARWLRMPPQKLMHLIHTSGNQASEMKVDYVVDTLGPWMKRHEEEIARKLFPIQEDGEFFAEHLHKALLRGDQKAQGVWYKNQFMIGAMSPNDIRECENENPYDGGDTYFVPSNMGKTKDVADGKFSKANKNPPGEIGNADGNGRPPRGEGKNADHLLPLFVDATERCLRREVRAAESAFKRCMKLHDGGSLGCKAANDAFEKWIAKFFVDQEGYWRSALEPLVFSFKCIADEWNKPSCAGRLQSLLDGWAMEQVAESIAALKEQWRAGTLDASRFVDRSDDAAGALFDRCNNERPPDDAAAVAS